MLTHLALICSMAGKMEQAKDYMKLIGVTPRHWQPQDITQKDFYRITLELVMPYTSDDMFLRIVFFLIRIRAVPVLGLTLSGCLL